MSARNDSFYFSLTLKRLRKNVADDILICFILFSKKRKLGICVNRLLGDSQTISNQIFSEKKK